jgi:hypothetical protein
MNISMSVRIIPNTCDDCWNCRPSNLKPEFVMFCIKRKIHKKNYRRCKLWISADEAYSVDKVWLHGVGIKDVVEAFQRGRQNERYRILKQVNP